MFTRQIMRNRDKAWVFRLIIMCCLLFCLVSASALAQGLPRIVRVYVALADNQNQGIVPVPAKLGNGEDPERNLYWGAAYGVKTFFARSPDWRLLTCRQNPRPEVLQRCTFRHRVQNVYLIADAYRGSQIKTAIADFLEAAAARTAEKTSVRISDESFLNSSISADLVAYVGHDGLMDFQLSSPPHGLNTTARKTIVLACLSRSYFAGPLRMAAAYPLLWTNGLMAPEAYILKNALDGWIANESDQQIRDRAAAAYQKYQKCGLTAARKLFSTGW